MVPTNRYCDSGPGNGDNSILTKLSVMPFCRRAAVHLKISGPRQMQMSGLFVSCPEKIQTADPGRLEPYKTIETLKSQSKVKWCGMHQDRVHLKTENMTC